MQETTGDFNGGAGEAKQRADAAGLAVSTLAERWTPHDWAMLRGIVAVAVIVFLGYLYVAGASSLWDRDEPRFSRAAVEMLHGGDWLVPQFNDRLRPDKPVLIYWLMSGSLKVLGTTEVALRMWSGVGVALAVIFTFLIARRLFDAKTAFLAGVILQTGLMPLYIGTAATSDGILLACIVFSVWAYIDALYTGVRWWHWLLLGFGLGLAQLAKGPVGLAVPVLGMVATAWLLRDGPWRVDGRYWKCLGLGVLLSAAIFLAWAWPANAATGGELAKIGLGRHVGERMVQAQEGHGGKGFAGYVAMLPFYVPVLLVAVFPWTCFLPGGLCALGRRAIGDARSRAVLWGWILPTFVLMSLVATKLPHYVLPIVPALAIAMSASYRSWRRGDLDELSVKWMHRGVWFFGPVALALVVVLLVVPRILNDADLAGGGLLAGVVALLLYVGVTASQFQGRLDRVLRWCLIGGPTLAIVGATFLLPAIEAKFKISPGLAKLVTDARPSGAPVVMHGYAEPSLVFYINLPPGERIEESLPGGIAGLGDWASEPEAGVLVITRQALESWSSDWRTLPLHKHGSYTAVNFNKGAREVEVLVLSRGIHARPSMPASRG